MLIIINNVINNVNRMNVKYPFIPLTLCNVSSVTCVFPQVSSPNAFEVLGGWSNKLWLTTVFYFADHRFASFPEVLYEISSLETILLGNNQINLLDPSRLIKLTHLSTLDLSNNDLLKIPPELGLCTSLRYLWSTLLFTGYFVRK